MRAALLTTATHPAKPTRAQVCAVKMTFQGLTVQTQQYGPLPWFDTALWSLSAADRGAVYAAKRTAGDTHAIIQYDDQPGSIYDEPGQPYQQMHGPAMELHPGALLAAVVESLEHGLIPCVFLGGDDGERGYPIAVRQLPKVVAELGDLIHSVLVVPGYDGVFYGWTPEHIAAFGEQFRALAPLGHLGIEHQPGRIPIGNGPSDWLNGGPMQAYDVLLSEFTDGPHLHSGENWEVAARVLGAAYRRPADQPAGDDLNPPHYLAAGTPRGPYFPVAFEFDEYRWVRGQVSAADVQAERDYLHSCGWSVC